MVDSFIAGGIRSHRWRECQLCSTTNCRKTNAL